VVTIRRILINLTELQLAELDRMVKKGEYSNRAEAVREATRTLIEKKKLEEMEEVG
jgi:metal-responsive CopG/Arc/MetJ family transcriptional regulator